MTLPYSDLHRMLQLGIFGARAWNDNTQRLHQYLLEAAENLLLSLSYKEFRQLWSEWEEGMRNNTNNMWEYRAMVRMLKEELEVNPAPLSMHFVLA